MPHPSGDEMLPRRQAIPKVCLAVLLLGIGLALCIGTSQAAGGTGTIGGRVTYVGGLAGDHPMYVCLYGGNPDPDCRLPSEHDGAYRFDDLADGGYTVKALVNVYTGDTINWDDAVEAWYDPDVDGQPDTVTVSGGSVSGIDISVGGPWIPLSGPAMGGGQVLALTADADAPEVVYAAVRTPGSTEAGEVFKSTDGGASWTAVYTPEIGAHDLTARGAKVCLSGYRDGGHVLVCSDDAGGNWRELDAIEPGHAVWISDLVISSEVSSTMLLAGNVVSITENSEGTDPAGVVYGTTDGGVSWERLLEHPNPDKSYLAYGAIIQDPSDPDRFFVSGNEQVDGDPSSAQAVIYRIENASWNDATRVYTSTDYIGIMSLAIDPGNGQVVLAGTSDRVGAIPDVLRSDDGGDSWVRVLEQAGSFVAIPFTGDAYANSPDGWVYASANGGATWGDGVLVGNYCGGFAAGTNLYAGGCADGVLRSTDGGATWAPSSAGMTLLVSPRQVAVDPLDPGRLYAAADCGGGFRSDDGGASWTLDLGSCVGAYAFDPRRAGIIYRGIHSTLHGALDRSVDGGQSWRTVYTATLDFASDPESETIIFAIAPAPSQPTTIYAGGADNPAQEGRYATIVRSTQDGVAGSWTEVFSMTHESWVNAIAVSPRNPLIAYAGGAWECSWEGCQGFIRRTTDGGATWSRVLTDTSEVKTITIDGGDPLTVYVGTAAYQVFRSDDGGDTWTAVRLPPEEGGGSSGDLVVADPRTPGRVYLAGWGTVLESADRGDTWLDQPGGLAPAPQLQPASLTVVNHGGRQTFYFGAEGVWSFTRLAPGVDSMLFLPAIVNATP